MNTEELLKPRIKVIQPMPFCKFEVGDILIQKMVITRPGQKDPELIWRRVSGKSHWGGQSVGIPMIKDPEKYPHLFKKLEWWEDRKPEDIPEYVKNVKNGTVIKVRKPISKDGNWFFNGKANSVPFYEYLPATQQEYEQSLVTNY